MPTSDERTATEAPFQSRPPRRPSIPWAGGKQGAAFGAQDGKGGEGSLERHSESGQPRPAFSSR